MEVDDSQQYAPLQQQPPIGIDPQNVFKAPKVADQRAPSQPPTKEGATEVYMASYSGVSVYEMMCRNVAVMRRQKDSYLNATQVLKVANIDKGRRTKILEKEILNRQHEKVQGGYGKYQGTWIPYPRGLELAKQFGVFQLLSPLFDYLPPNGKPSQTPTKDQVLGSQPAKSAKRITQKTFQVEKRVKMDSNQTYVETQDHTRDHSAHYLTHETSFGEQFFDYQDQKVNYPNQYFEAELSQPPTNPEAEPTVQASNRHRAALMALFLNNHPNAQEILSPHTNLPSDFDIDLVLDDQGHTAMHWAAALANVTLLGKLILKGSRDDSINLTGESALIRSVMVAHNYEMQTFVNLLTILKETICIRDKKNRTVLHHICLSASIKGRVASCVYYMQSLIDFYKKTVYDESVSSELVHSDDNFTFLFKEMLDVPDICGDTAINITARLGNQKLYSQLLEIGADPSIPNFASLKPLDYGFIELFPKTTIDSPLVPSLIPSLIYPSIRNDLENNSSSRQEQIPLSEKSQTEIISELRGQLSSISREISEYRSEINPLRTENSHIPALKARIQVLESSLKDKKVKPIGIQKVEDQPLQREEVVRLREALTNQRAIEAHLCLEMTAMRSRFSVQESNCKRIVAALCKLPLDKVDTILQPLLDALTPELFDREIANVNPLVNI